MQDRKFICPCYRHKQDIAETGRCICGLFVRPGYRAPDRLEAPPIRREGTPWPPITVYGAVWCRDTIRTRTADQIGSCGAVRALFQTQNADPACEKVKGLVRRCHEASGHRHQWQRNFRYSASASDCRRSRRNDL